MAKGNEKGSLLLLVASAAVIVLLAAQVKPAVAQVIIPVVASKYTTAMETAVWRVVDSNKEVAPGLIRLLFHDAFVRGCDGSVLLDSTPTNKFGQTEKNSNSNGFLRGLDLIQKIRDEIFKGVGVNISCADAIVFAAREATSVLSNGNIKYDIDGPGRQDGVISSIEDPGKFLPSTTHTFTELKKRFEAKTGFGVKELVALSGAHCIGVTHLKAFEDRLHPNVSSPERDEINPDYQAFIKNESDLNPNGAFLNNIRDMGQDAQKKCGYKKNNVNLTAVHVVDNSLYNAILQNMNRFQSDWVLRTNTVAETLLKLYGAEELVWRADFSAAMTKLSNDLKSEGPVFEVGFRKDCTRTNLNFYPPPRAP